MIIRTAIGIAVICAAAMSHAWAQADRWNELTTEVNQLYSLGRAADAIPAAKQALDIAKKTFGIEHLNYGLSLNNLALLYSATGKYSDAESLFKKSVAVLEKSQNSELARPLGNLANMYAAQGKYVEAEGEGAHALEATKKAYGPESLNTALAQQALAMIYARGGRPLDAEHLYKQALTIEQQALPPDHVELGKIYGNLGYLYETEGKRTDAEAMYRQALTIFQKTLSPQDPLIATTEQYLSRVSGAPSSPAVLPETMLFQQCMNEYISRCMHDCTVNYRYKESKCSNELCSITNSKTIDNKYRWSAACQKKIERKLRESQ